MSIKCRLCNSDIDLNYNRCRYCGVEYSIDLDGDMVIDDLNYGPQLLKRLGNISLQAYTLDGPKEIPVNTASNCFNEYQYVYNLSNMHPGKNTSIDLMVDHKLIQVPISLPYTRKNIRLGVKIDQNYRLRVKVGNETIYSESKPCDLLQDGAII